MGEQPTTHDTESVPASVETEGVKGKRKSVWVRRTIIGGCLLLTLWLIGDFAYSRYVDDQIQEWESQIERDDEGVRSGCHAYTKGNGETALLLVHGFNETPGVWHKMVPELVTHGYTCRAIRLPGFGESIPAYAGYSTEDWLNHFEQELKRLAEDHDSVVVVAHSLGAAVALHHLLNHADSMDGVVLLAPAIDSGNVRSPLFSSRTWHEFAKRTMPFTRVAMSVFEYDAKDPEERAVKLRNKFSPRRVISNLYELVDFNRHRAGQLRTPVRFFVSPDDQVVDVAKVQSYFEDWESADKKMFRLENSGHAIPVDLDWKQVVKQIDSFARSLADPAERESDH